jgi:glycosyltransferase involved in cell wall biosynthesis
MTGAERMLDHILRCFPGADVYTAVDFLPEEHRGFLGASRVVTSFVQKLPRARTAYWNYIPLMPFAFERFDLRGYDLVISNSHTVAKGLRTQRAQPHLCCLQTPMRFAWDLEDDYLERFRIGGARRVVARRVLRAMRDWDRRTATRVDEFLSISRFVASRCERFYGRSSTVLYPPVDVDYFVAGSAPREDFFLTASRLTPFKRIDLIVEAFKALPDHRLIVIGDGPERARIEAIRTANVTYLGYQRDDVLRDYMQRARAFVFAAPEDFGLVMAEAQACGTPVIALGVGGACEIVRGLDDDPSTGVLFPEATASAIGNAVAAFERHESRFVPSACRANSLRFSPELFRNGLSGATRRLIEGRSSATQDLAS